MCIEVEKVIVKAMAGLKIKDLVVSLALLPSPDDYRAFVADYIATRRLTDVLEYLKEW